MNGMLHHYEHNREVVERRQVEAQGWARANALGRLSRSARAQYPRHPVRTRLFAIASPMAVALGIAAILS